MSGILLKDLFTIKKSYISNLIWTIIINLFCVLLAIGSVYGNFKGMIEFGIFLYVSCFTPFLVGLACFAVFHFDKESGFGDFEKTLPVSDENKVLARYILAIICILSSVFYIIIPLLCCIVTGQTIPEKFIFVFIVVMQVTGLFICVVFPAIYRAKGGKLGRIIVVFALYLIAGIVGILFSIFPDLGEFLKAILKIITDNMVISAVIFQAIVVVSFIVSYKVSVKIYKRKRGVIT